MKEDRSVIDHLVSIEDNIEKASKPATISECIGEDFRNYFNSSTAYLLETDERKFNRYRKSGINLSIIVLLVCSLPIIVDIILSICFKQVFWMALVGSLICLIFPLVCLVYYVKSKPKRLATSKWNLSNIEFYISADNRFCYERSKGAISILSIVSFWLWLIALALGFAQCFMLELDVDFRWFIIVVCVQVLVVIFSSNYLKERFRDYSYPSLVFEKDDSYVIYQYNEWKKVTKTGK